MIIRTAFAFGVGGIVVLATVGAAEVARWWKEASLARRP